MLGLPSTTEVGRRLPKEAFYKNLKLDARTREEFVRFIDRITVANSVKPATANVADSERVHEVIVLAIDLKGDEVPSRALAKIAEANPHELVFALSDGSVAVWRSGLHVRGGIDHLSIAGATMDEAWDSFCAQVLFGDADGRGIDVRIDRKRRRESLEAEIASLDAKMRKERQTGRKNELFAQLRAKRRELEKRT